MIAVYPIGQVLWTMNHNEPVAVYVSRIEIQNTTRVVYYLATTKDILTEGKYSFSKSGREVAETLYELRDKVFKPKLLLRETINNEIT